MTLNDYIAIGILCLCTVLGFKGVFRWVLGAVVGLLFGVLILAIAAALCFVPFIGDSVREPLTRGIIIPYIAEQFQKVGQCAGLDIPATADRSERSSTSDRARDDLAAMSMKSWTGPIRHFLGSRYPANDGKRSLSNRRGCNNHDAR